MPKISRHFLIFCSSLFLTLFCNTYFFKIISPLTNSTNFLLIGVLLFALLALALEILCLGVIWGKSVLIAIFLIVGASSYSINSLQVGITPDIIFSILTANPTEISETLNASLLLHLFLFFILPSGVVFAIKIKRISLLKALILKVTFIVAYTLLALFIWFGFVGKEVTFLFKQNRVLYYVVNPISPIRSFVQYLNDQQKRHLTFTQVGLDGVLQKGEKPKVIVFVIGESARGANFSLNGYAKPTNPLLTQISQKGYLLSFKDFSSCGVITAISVPCMMSDYTHATYTKRYLSDFRENILDVTQRMGIDTYYIGNNGGGCIGGICNRLKEKNVKFYNDGHLDGVMLEDLQNILKNAKSDTFIVMHQMGSHGQSYFKRYPKEFEHFAPTCQTSQIQNCSLESLQNTYDNSILYTDFILSQSIQELEKVQNRFDVALWYVSDHGESLGENGMYMHGGLPYLVAPKVQTHIPSILWLGNGFKKAYEQIKSKENDELSQDYVFHTLLALWGIKTQDFNPQLSLMH